MDFVPKVATSWIQEGQRSINDILSELSLDVVPQDNSIMDWIYESINHISASELAEKESLIYALL